MIKKTMVMMMATAGIWTMPVATSPAAAASRYSVEAECSDGMTDVVVLNWSGYGLAMYIYENGRQVLAKRAIRTVTEDSARLELVQYKAGTVTNGGASLRIRVRDSLFPDLEGSAHLTQRGSNDLMHCDIAN